MFQSVQHSLSKYADFKGRASRSEFWTFFLFVILAQALARVVDAFFGAVTLLPGPVYFLTAALLFIPQVSVTIRRLHDTGNSGKELLVPFAMLLAAPLIYWFGGFIAGIIKLGYGGIVMLMWARILYLLAREGHTVPNKYGASPTAFSWAKGN
ncbi:DUF805 domain-containing protein [Sphingomicrobium flavum]|uniref:DUF805 domain-containing protein n=1 Tax=Sphingomicrobium flavum TaxID=1229164 RepID=UPI0021ADA847|nr:DUF805 domain-containing protein [Sphingomicrobium flavum]